MPCELFWWCFGCKMSIETWSRYGLIKSLVVCHFPKFLLSTVKANVEQYSFKNLVTLRSALLQWTMFFEDFSKTET